MPAKLWRTIAPTADAGPQAAVYPGRSGSWKACLTIGSSGSRKGKKLVLSLATSELVAYKSTCSYNWTCSYNLPLATGYRLAANPPEVANPGKTMAAGKPVLAVDLSVAGTGEKEALSVATSELVAYKSTCSYK